MTVDASGHRQLVGHLFSLSVQVLDTVDEYRQNPVRHGLGVELQQVQGLAVVVEAGAFSLHPVYATLRH